MIILIFMSIDTTAYSLLDSYEVVFEVGTNIGLCEPNESRAP